MYRIARFTERITTVYYYTLFMDASGVFYKKKQMHQSYVQDPVQERRGVCLPPKISIYFPGGAPPRN